jgi:uncharacterized membrane protein YadS
MRHLLTCRRTYIATLGILCCTVLGAYLKIDVSLAIMGAVASICGANATEAIMKKDSKNV